MSVESPSHASAKSHSHTPVESHLPAPVKSHSHTPVESHSHTPVESHSHTPVKAHSHTTTTLLVAGLRQITASVLFLISYYLDIPPFDSSHRILDEGVTPGLRWDALHYASIAVDGYTFEQQLAFMPLWPAAMRVGGELAVWSRTILSRVVTPALPLHLTFADVSGGTANILANALAARMLYKLTREVSGSTRFAALSSLFYAFPPHPASIASPYTEPSFALFTFAGFYYAVKGRWAWSTASLALATALRSTGVFNIGILGWMVLFGTQGPSLQHLFSRNTIQRSLLAAVLCSIVLAPFVGFQYYAYRSFCLGPTHRPWCDATIPMAYSFVQAEYWNVGLFKYWTVAQLPNFLLAAPVLAVSLLPTVAYFQNLRKASATSLPFHIHHLFLTLLLIVSSHTQIALRVCITDPVVWWNVATVAFDPSPAGAGSRPVLTTAGKLWVGWVVVYGTVSLFLWAGHYPPA